MNSLTQKLGTFYALSKKVTLKDLIDILSEYDLNSEINDLQIYDLNTSEIERSKIIFNIITK